MISPSLHDKYSNYHYCIVRECKNTSIKTPGKLWIRVPSEINMRNTWLKLAKRDPDSLSAETKMYFCEDHFDVSTYLKYIQSLQTISLKIQVLRLCTKSMNKIKILCYLPFS